MDYAVKTLCRFTSCCLYLTQYALATKSNSTLSTVDKVESTFEKVEGASTLPIGPTRAFRDARHDFPVVRQKTRRERQDDALSTLVRYRSTARTQRQK